MCNQVRCTRLGYKICTTYMLVYVCGSERECDASHLELHVRRLVAHLDGCAAGVRLRLRVHVEDLLQGCFGPLGAGPTGDAGLKDVRQQRVGCIHLHGAKAAAKCAFKLRSLVKTEHEY